jgi:hypothetical protein
MKTSIGILSFTLALSNAAWAKGPYLTKFTQAYPEAKTLASKRCVICHEAMNDFRRNTYGRDFEKAAQNFQAIEALDSDGDSFTNIEEIKAGTLPGDKLSFPAQRAE